MNDEILKFNCVDFFYRPTPFSSAPPNVILKGISFELYQGEVLGVIGKNGAGKSTLLRLLADIIKPNSGSIWRKENTRAQLLTLSLGFIQELSGEENAILSLVLQGFSIREAKNHLAEIATYSGLKETFYQPLKTFSSGEKSRLGFSLAMKSKPDILLLDEILGVGDQEFRKKSAEALAKRVKSNQTAVLVSHNPNTLLKFCDRTLWLSNGTIKMIGDSTNVIDRYEND